MSIETEGQGPETAADAPVDLRDELASAFDSPETAAADTGTTATAAPATAGAEQNAAPLLQAPKHWSEADRSLFGKALPDIQKRWLDREGEFTKGVDAKAQELASLRREWDPIAQAFAPFERDLGLRGVSRQQFMGSLMETHKWLTQEPDKALRWVAEQYGVDLKQLHNDPAAAQVDPQIQKLSQGFETIQQRLDRQDQDRQTREHQDNLSRVSSFAEAKDDKGNPLRPHFDAVADDIIRLMKAGERDLDAAYTKACRMNDKVWDQMQADKQLADKNKMDDAAKARIEKARRAAVGTDGQVNGSAKPKTLREDLESAFSNLQ